jgi:hypothetical protein
MSMDSPSRPADAPPRGLGSRRRLRLLAVTLWTGFLGAMLITVAGVALLPAEAAHGLGWAELSVAFLCAWALTTVPVLLALALADTDGR